MEYRVSTAAERDLSDAPDPADMPVLIETQCVLPEAVGHQLDCTALSESRWWCRYENACSGWAE